MNSSFPRFFVSLICLAGAALSVLSLYDHLSIQAGLHSSFPFCELSRTISCRAVLTSKWAYFLGFPLGMYGVAFFLGILVLAGVDGLKRSAMEAAIADACYLFALISVLISIALFTVSKVAIGSLCPVCLSTYLTCILLLIACHFWRGSDTFGARIRSGMAAVLFSPLILLGLGGPAKAAEARLASLSLLLVLSTTLFLPDFLFVQFIKERGELRKSELAQQAVANWRSAEPVTFDFKEEGLEKDHSKGPDQALIAVAEFSDFECPSCRIFYFMLEPLLEEYAGKVRLTLLNYPLDKSCNPGIHGDFHKSACLAAFATRCAGEQGEFWKMADYIFKMEELDAPEASLEEVRAALLHGAEALNLDRQAFDECLQSGRHAAKIASDIELGNRLGVKGTPSLWINGRKVEVLTIQGLRSIFDEILKAKPTN